MRKAFVTGGNVAVNPIINVKADRRAAAPAFVLGLLIAGVGIALVANAMAVTYGVHTTATTYTSGTHDVVRALLGGAIVVIGSVIFTIGLARLDGITFRMGATQILTYGFVLAPPVLILTALLSGFAAPDTLRTWGEQHAIQSMSLPDVRGENNLTFTRDTTDGKVAQIRYVRNANGTYTLTLLNVTELAK